MFDPLVKISEPLSVKRILASLTPNCEETLNEPVI